MLCLTHAVPHPWQSDPTTDFDAKWLERRALPFAVFDV